MTGSDRSELWADTSFLREVQYKTDANLAARQAIYAYQQPPVDLVGRVLSLAAPNGSEVITDIGCGNGLYLAELARRGHTGPVLGVDMSPGMLHAARRRAGQAGLLVADATALPVRDAAADITRPGGRLIVGLNGDDHLRELRDIVTAALASIGERAVPLMYERLSLDQGEELLRSEFASVTRHDLMSKLLLPSPEPVAAYVRSMSETTLRADPEALIAAVTSRLPPAPAAVFEVTTHSGCLICA